MFVSSTIRGFHLLEMLAVLCLISILAVIGYTSYSHYVLRAARMEAVMQLHELSMQLERAYAENQHYVNVDYTSHNQHYAITSIIQQDYYELTAMPISALAKEHACGSLMLNSQGERKMTGSASLKDCWM